MKSCDGFGTKLRIARKRANLTQRELAERIGARHNSISQWESGINRPSQDIIKALCNELNVTADFLLGIAAAPVRIEGLPAIPNLVAINKCRVPVLGDIAAGKPIIADRAYGEKADVDTELRCDFALRVAGDSMEPLILRNDLVFIQQADDVDDGQIAAVIVDDSATLKRVYHTRDGLQLISENHRYPPMLVKPEDGFPVRILGRAVSFRRIL